MPLTPSIDARRLEERFLNSMTPPEQVLYDGWLLRFAPHDVKRARSVNAVAASRLPLDEKLDYCEMFHRERGQAPLYRLTSFDPPELDEALAARRYRRFDESLVLAATLRPPPAQPGEGLRFEMADSRRFAEQVGAMRGSNEAARAAHLRRLTYGTLPQFRLLAWQEDALVGAAMLMREDEWAGLFDVHVEASRRRQGVGRALCAYLMEQARLWGSERAWLAVEEANHAAMTLYERLGFEPVYRYWYREADDALA